MNKILVVGATGPQGRPVAEKLLEAGFTVRALARDPAKAQDLADRGAEVVPGDLDDPDSIRAAVAGQDGVFLLVSFFTGTHRQARTVIDAAKDARVDQIVWNVAGRVQEHDVGNPSIDKWRPILADLKASGIPFVALQPTVYMENLLIPAIAQKIAEDDVFAYPMPVVAHSQWISHQDTAAYTVAAFQRTERDQLVIDVSGPEDLTGDRMAERLSAALGRTIHFRPMPPEEFAAAISYGGNEEAIVGHYRNIYAQPDMMTSNVDHAASLAVLPITPVSMEDWGRMYRDALSST